VAVLLAVLAGPARGQSSANLTAVAVVTTEPPTLVAVEDLRFGPLREGEAVTVDPRSSLAAAKFEIHGASHVDFTLDFSLPQALRSARGQHTLAVRFGATDACAAPQDEQRACTAFNPASSLLRRRLQPGGSKYIWLGGTIVADPSQAPGEYTGVVTATLRYTGV
jgi:hypothetical protein